MQSTVNKYLNFHTIVIFCCILALAVSAAWSEENYTFERFWPTIQQPWYFDSPQDVAVDDQGFVYLTDIKKHLVQKFTSDGKFVSSWGKLGNGDGEFFQPSGIAADNNGFVYVADQSNNRIQKFSQNGKFVAKWGSKGETNGQFDKPSGIAADQLGFIYVTDLYNDRVQKFTKEGIFISTWGSSGSETGQFNEPSAIAVDNQGFIYVADEKNNRIQKFTDTGKFKGEWGNGNPVNFNGPKGVAADSQGFIYVADHFNNRIQKFTTDGNLLAEWGAKGFGNGEFKYPVGIAPDKHGYIYVADQGNKRIQKFLANGNFVAKWGSVGNEIGEFNDPSGMIIDNKNFIYVADQENHRIQKFTVEGNFVKEWGHLGSEDGAFDTPADVAWDSEGFIYVADSYNYRIQKFTEDGKFITKWTIDNYGTPSAVAVDNANGYSVYIADSNNNRIQKFTKSGELIDASWGGEFSYPHGIAVDSLGFVYITEFSSNRVQKFDADGNVVKVWGNTGEENGEFNIPTGITVDSSDNIYVSDNYNHRIQKFTSEGEFTTKSGENGSGAGQLSLPKGICINPNTGTVYVSDSGNNRIQAYRKQSEQLKAKAIIIAGGGPYPANELWDATQINANFAYISLSYRGFDKNNIYYLSSNTELDLDNNGEFDEVDEKATNANLEKAITKWAAEETSCLLLYLTDHGGNTSFRMSATETLSASQIDTWLDMLQAGRDIQVIVIYDACRSGSFVSELSGENRLVITSTDSDESAYFITQGSISFSSYFWTHIFNGEKVGQAYELAKKAMTEPIYLQSPQWQLYDDLNNEPKNYTSCIDNFVSSKSYAPEIENVSSDQTITQKTSAELAAYSVTSTNDISRVWAVIRPPDYVAETSDNPVNDLPSIDLRADGENNYTGIYDGFTQAGTYQITIYARDGVGNTSVPKLTTVNVGSPLKRRAIIVAGGSTDDALWKATEKNISLAYKSLTFQGYSENDIYLISPVKISDCSNCMYGLPDINVFHQAVEWAKTDTKDLLIYMIGKGDDGIFEISNSQNLSAEQLDEHFDDLEKKISGKIIFIYDAPKAGSFLPFFKSSAEKERILIASTAWNQQSYFLHNGIISFSNFFWRRVLNGANIWNAFLQAKNAMNFSCQIQTAQLDDNGNGVGNDSQDGMLSRTYTVGTGIMLADDSPVVSIAENSQAFTVTDQTANISVDDVTTTGTVEQVYAVVMPPCFTFWQQDQSDVSLINLSQNSSDDPYENQYDINIHGEYNVLVYAEDEIGNISMPATAKTLVNSDGILPDQYESDDTLKDANIILINDQDPKHTLLPGYDWRQMHNFHSAGDEDWVRFYAHKRDAAYTISITSAGEHCNAVIEIYNSSGHRIFQDANNMKTEKHADWNCPADGVYYIRIRQKDSDLYGEGTTYHLSLSIPAGTFSGFVMGSMIPASVRAILTTNGMGEAMTLPNGAFFMPHIAGDFAITVEALGYEPYEKSISVKELDTTNINIKLVPLPNYTPPPEKPVISSPNYGYTVISLTPELETEAFSDPLNGSHGATQWQISKNLDFSSLSFDLKSSSNLTSLALPELLLDANETYYWRVRFINNNSNESEWTGSYFITPDSGLTDDNSNGIPDIHEADDNTDLDGNGIDDILQDDIKSVNSVIGNVQIGIKALSNVKEIQSIKPLHPDSISNLNKPEKMPFGLIAFRLETADSETTEVTLTVYLSEPLPAGSRWYKYDVEHGWRDYSNLVTFSEKSLTITLKDGDYGDADGTENGIIVDPSGIAIIESSIPAPPKDSSGSGCFINTVLLK
ncbi:tripartite motif-containing protein 71 [Candidatus Magnetomoraceae bacterium gMMP-15]